MARYLLLTVWLLQLFAIVIIVWGKFVREWVLNLSAFKENRGQVNWRLWIKWDKRRELARNGYLLMLIAVLLFCTAPESAYYFLWQRSKLAFFSFVLNPVFSLSSSYFAYRILYAHSLKDYHIILFTCCEIGFCGLIWKASSFSKYNSIAIISFRWNLRYSNTLVIFLTSFYSQIIPEFLLMPLY